MLKEFNRLNSKVNTILNPIVYINREWYNSFTIISFDSNLANDTPKVEYLIRDEYEESNIENSMLSNKEIIKVIDEKTTGQNGNMFYIAYSNGNIVLSSTTYITDKSKLLAGPFFIEKEALDALSILSTLYI